MATVLKKKVLVLGSTGLLGSTLVPFLTSLGYDVKTHSRSNEAQYIADLCNAKQAGDLLDTIQPEVVVNLIGMTDVERCERQPHQAYLANVQVVENIADWIREKESGCHFIHISTDQVYDGPGLHSEEQVTLTNYYAFSKYAGELAAAKVESTILRTNFIGRSHCAKRVSLTDWLYQSLSTGTDIQVFDDVWFSPLSMFTLSKMIELTIKVKPTGVYNLGSHLGMSKSDFAFAFAEELNCTTQTLTRIRTDQVTFLKTYRPKDMRMDCNNFEKTLGIKLPKLVDEIKLVAKEYYEIT